MNVRRAIRPAASTGVALVMGLAMGCSDGESVGGDGAAGGNSAGGTSATGGSSSGGSAAGGSAAGGSGATGGQGGTGGASTPAGLGSPRGQILAFSSGFETDVSVGPVQTAGDDANYWWGMDGQDVAGSDFCSDMIGDTSAIYGGCWFRTLLPTAHDFSDYYEAPAIVSTTGPLGTTSNVLQWVQKDYVFIDPHNNRIQWNVAPTGNSPPDDLSEYYLEYDIKISLSEDLTEGYLMFWEQIGDDDQARLCVKRVSSVGGDDYYWELNWHEGTAPTVVNTDDEVPLDQWFTVGIHYRASTTDSGRISLWANDSQIFAYEGPTDTAPHVATGNLLKLYTYDHVQVTYLIDNFEVYETVH